MTLTDIRSQQSHLQRNIEINRLSYEGSCQRVSRAILHFGDQKLIYEVSSSTVETNAIKNTPSSGLDDGVDITGTCIDGHDVLSVTELQDFDVILGADIGYDLSLHEPIGVTLISLLQRERKKHQSQNSNSVCSSSHFPRIALLAEEIRWSDIHDWYMTSVLDAVCNRNPPPSTDDDDDDESESMEDTKLNYNRNKNNDNDTGSDDKIKTVQGNSSFTIRHETSFLREKMKSSKSKDNFQFFSGSDSTVKAEILEIEKHVEQSINAIHLLTLMTELDC